jgi:catechol 2,3-dioxygenase-like lactoylglutathione lyase family enzyme
MLGDRMCAAMLPAADYERAKQWYADKLDLKPIDDTPAGANYKCADGTRFSVYPSQYAGTNQSTAMAWLVDDLSTEMKDLKTRGVTFEEYDIPGIKTEGGVAELAPDEKGAWFRDSEGNILAIFQSPRYK